MKRLAFAIVGTASLVLSACDRKNEDQVQNVQLNQPSADELNEQANQAAMDAANAQAAADAKMHSEENAVAPADTSPNDADEQNVSGM
jgi:hypothetical protein